MLKGKMLILILSLVVVLFLGIPSMGYALTQISIYDGSTLVTIIDNGSGDSDSRQGVINYSGTMGVWALQVVVAQSVPFTSTAAWPYLDMTFMATSSASGSLDLWMTTTDLTAPGPPALHWGIGGITDGTVSYAAYRDASNSLFGTSQTLGTLGPYGNNTPFQAFVGTAGTSVASMGALYSLSQHISISHPNPQYLKSLTTGNAHLSAVPEPTTLLLLGSGLLGLGAFSRLRRKKK